MVGWWSRDFLTSPERDCVRMEELYGKTTLPKPLPPQEPKFHRTNFGRVTPSDLNRSQRQGYLAAGRHSPLADHNRSRPQPTLNNSLMIGGGRASPDFVKMTRNAATAAGRITPELNKSRQTAFSGRLTPPATADTSTTGAGIKSATTTTPATASMRQKQQQQPASGGGLLNISSHNSSKLSSTNSGVVSNQTKTTADGSHDLNSTQISPISVTRKALLDRLNSTTTSQHNGGYKISREKKNGLTQVLLVSGDSGVREMLQSLGLLCLVSLLLALLSLVFLVKISPMPSRKDPQFLTQAEYVVVYEVTLAMCCISLCLNLSCLLVCVIQYLFTAKLVRSSQGRIRSSKYLKKAGVTRVCAIVGFILSIPLFLIGIVLFTFLHFNSTPAIVTSIVIGIGIIFCGGAVVHNVFLWQRERTVNRREGSECGNKSRSDTYIHSNTNGLPQLSHITLPHATLDLSGGLNGTLTAKNLELSTLV